MRITNNMISDNASMNINGNKIRVDADNTRMTTQKKIDRPSEDPVIAVRSLRLQTSLAKINQYYEKNIPDANSWLDVTETALLNIKDIMTDVRTLCVKGSTDTLTEDDRKTIYDQLQALQKQCFAEGNASYAERTVFTGFRTDKNLAFMDEDKNTRYNIQEPLVATDMVKSRFYTNKVDLPSNATEVDRLNPNDPNYVDPEKMTIDESDYYKLRLSYNLENVSGTGEDTLTAIHFRNPKSDGSTVENCKIDWGNGSATSTSQIISYTSPTGLDSTVSTYQTITPDPVEYTEGAVNTIYQFENESDWAAWSKMQAPTQDEIDAGIKVDENGLSKVKYVPSDAIVVIKETGELVFGENVATYLMNNKKVIAADYTKAGFHEGELRPEYYFDSTLTKNEKGVDKDVNGKDLAIKYDRYTQSVNDAGKTVYTPMISYSIDYTISQNQTLGVNLEANQCFDHNIYQDMDDMINSVSLAMAAHDKYDKIKAMMGEEQYQAPPYPELLEGWLKLAEKEMDYFDDNMSKLYSETLGKVDRYLGKVTLSITDLGCRMDQLKLTEKRMSDQQEAVEELKSENDNMDLSEIIMNYTSSYTAYQSSLVAAGKLGEQTLLNYI